jgi:hypothetical protein
MSKPALHTPVELLIRRVAELEQELSNAKRDIALLRLCNSELYQETVRLLRELGMEVMA